MKPIHLFITVLLSLSTINASAKETPVITSQVVDLANVIPDDKEAVIRKEIIAFEKSTKHQLAVITVPDLNDLPVEDYSLNIARQWKGGREGVDDGVLIFFYPGDGTPGSGKIRFEVGSGLEYILTDAQSSRIIRNTMVYTLKQDKPRSETIPAAILAGVRSTIKLGNITPEQKADFDAKEKAQRIKEQAEAKAAFQNFLFYAFIFIIIVGCIILFYIRMTRAAREKLRLARKEEERVRKELSEKRWTEYRANEKKKQEELLAKREAMLNAMSPGARANFLRSEQAQLALRAQAAKQREIEQANIRRKRYEEEEALQAATIIAMSSSQSDFNLSSSSNSDDRSSDDSDRYSGGGGGDFGGGGDTESF